MFKKIILVILIFSPLWHSLFIGYPVISDKEYYLKEKEYPNISISKRCFAVGDFKEFTNCFTHSERIKGTELANSVIEKIDQISPLLTVILFVSLTIFISVSIYLLLVYLV